jgi:hypothetical protein
VSPLATKRPPRRAASRNPILACDRAFQRRFPAGICLQYTKEYNYMPMQMASAIRAGERSGGTVRVALASIAFGAC